MGLTVDAGDPFATFITGEVSGAIGYRSPLYVFGRGTGGESGVLFLKNGDVTSVAVGEDSYTRVADTPTSLETAATRPV
jgi:hypothetical protein